MAHAASQDAAAQELADEAIFTDYLQLDFKAGEKKLKKAIQLCERGTCSPTVQAQVYRDLAVIYITGMKRSADGQKLLVRALRLDPNVALDADLTTPELIRVFGLAKDEVAQEEAAKKKKGASRPSSAADEDEDEVESAPPGIGSASAEAEAETPTGSMDQPVRAGSVDCPPDFPGCESIDEGARAEAGEAPADLGIRNWLAAALQQDFLMFSGQSGVCGPEQPDELSCFRAGDTFRPGTAQNTAGEGGSIAGGFRVATTRLLIGYDRVLFPNISAGVRVGYAIGGGPAEPNGAGFVPIHAELRGTYWFGALQSGNFRPYATLAGGLAQVDSSVTTQVVDRCEGPTEDVQCTPGQIAQSRVTVWKKTGTTFAALGGGALYPLSDHSGINVELKALLLFPSSGMSMSLQGGYTHGF